jgi:hypothetical protein
MQDPNKPAGTLRAVMEIDKGEEIAGAWCTAAHPTIGTFKLLLKKTREGRLEWAHFLQAPDGGIGMVLRGELRNPEELSQLKAVIHRSIQNVTGLELRLQDSVYLAYTVDGQPLNPVAE